MVQTAPIIASRSFIALPAAVIICIAIALFALGGVIAWRVTSSMQTVLSQAALARQEVETVDQLRLGLTAAESAQRGYLLTGAPAALAPFAGQVAQVNTALTRLAALAQQDEWVNMDLPHLRDAAERKIADLRHSIDVYQSQGQAAALAWVQTDDGRIAMEQARAFATDLSQRANAQRASYFRDLSSRQTQIGLGALIADAIGVSLLGFAGLRQLVARARLTRAQALLRAQSARLQATVDNIRDGVAVFDPFGRLLLWNALFFPVSGFPPALASPGTAFTAFAAAATEAGWPDLKLTDPPPPPGTPTIHTLDRADQVLEVWRSFLPDGGQMLAVADITRRTQAEAIAAQAQKMEALGHLTGGVAHDFNNLLQVVSANLELIAARLPEASPLAPRLTTAMAGVERGARLTRHLLAFARRQPLTPVALDTTALMAGLAEMLPRTLGAAIHIEVTAPAGLWPINADPQQLENALLNLAINARDAMAGGGRLTIEASNAALDSAYAAANADVVPGQYVVIAVTDTGIGMTPAQVARAVEPFYTTKPEGAGTGLGLSMVYGFARQSGGHFKLYSEPGHGTTARLYIPRSEALPAPAPAETGDTPRGTGELILVVEDDEAVRTTVCLALEELGYRVQVAETGAAALTLLREGARPDLLFSDVVMPGPPNATALAAEASRLVGPGLVVAFTSGYTENSIVHNGRLDPDVRLISKPWRLDELARFLRSALDARPTTSSQGTTGRATSRGRRVLLVEDEALISMTTADLLAELGYEVEVAETGAEALRALENEVDVLITDLGLPDMDGTALIAAARHRHRDLAVIVASGRASAKAEIAGDVIWLRKPYDSEGLRQALSRAMRAAA